MAQIMGSHLVKQAFFFACWCGLVLLLASRNAASQDSSSLEFPWMYQSVSGYYNDELDLEPNTWLVEPTIENPEVLCDGPWTVSYQLYPAGGSLRAPSTWPQGSSSIKVKSTPSWVSWTANNVKAELTAVGVSPAACKASKVKPTLLVVCDNCIGVVAKVTFSRVSQTNALPGGARIAVPLYVPESSSTEPNATPVLGLHEKQPLMVTRASSQHSTLAILTGRAQVQLKVAPSATGYPLRAVFTFIAREGGLIRRFALTPRAFGSLPLHSLKVHVDAAGEFATASIDTVYPSDQASQPISHEYVMEVTCDGCATEGATLHFEPIPSSSSSFQAKNIQSFAPLVRGSSNTTLNATLVPSTQASGSSSKTGTHWRLTAAVKNPQILCDKRVQLTYAFNLDAESTILSMNWELDRNHFTAQPNNGNSRQVLNWSPLVTPSDVETYCGDSAEPAVLGLNIICHHCTAPTSRYMLVAPVDPIEPPQKPVLVQDILSAALEPATKKQLVQFTTQVKDASLLCSQRGFHAIYRFDESSDALTDANLTARNSLGVDLGVMPVGTCVASEPVVCAFKIFSTGTDDQSCKHSSVDLSFSVYRAPTTKHSLEGSLVMNAPLASH